jgi:hypothetical protein
MIPRYAPLLLVLDTLAALGCDGVLQNQEVFNTGGGSNLVVFAALGGDTADVVVSSPGRVDLDLFTHDGGGAWRPFGSFFSGGVTDAVVPGSIGGRDVVLIHEATGSVAMLSVAAGAPHRLSIPIDVFRRRHDGNPIDMTPPARQIDVADIDGDGSDDLLASAGSQLYVIQKLANLLDANPDFPPPAGGFTLHAGAQPSAVLAVDLDGDGRRDLLALDEVEAALRVYRNLGAQAQFFDDRPQVTQLPAIGLRLLSTGCPATPVLVVLKDGRTYAIGADGSATAMATLPPSVRLAAAAAGTAAMVTGRTAGVEIYGGCSFASARAQPLSTQITSLAVGQDAPRSLAILDADGRTLSLYQLAN